MFSSAGLIFIEEDTMLDEITITVLDEQCIDSTSGDHGQITLIFSWVMFTVVCQAVDVFGVMTNIVNIVCFAKQGFREAINISLLGLAVSDLCCLMTLIWSNICFTPAFTVADVPFDVMDVAYMTAGMPHLIFNRISAWVTAIITLERCMCIMMPIQVRSIFTPRKASAIIISVFIILIVSSSVIFMVNRLEMKFYPSRNRTLIGLVSTSDKNSVEKISFIVNNFLLPLIAFLIIIVTTVILVISLQRRSGWLKSSVSLSAELSRRNVKVSKMVVMISTLFITSFIPVTVFMFALVFEPHLMVGGKYMVIGTMFGGFGILLESINSSTNIFIYYHMSTNYRDTFHNMFWIFYAQIDKQKLK